MVLDRRSKVVSESLRRFLRRSAYGHLSNLVAKIRPADFPPIYNELTDREGTQFFKILAQRDAELGSELLVELRLSDAVELIEALPIDAAARLIQECSGDDGAKLLAELDEDRSAEILKLMQPDDKAAVEQLLIYEEETAGRIMTPEVFALHEDTSVGEAVAAVQARGEDVEMVFYLYVVDERDHVVGVLSLRELLTHPPHLRIGEFMNADVITVQTETDQEEVARLASKYDLLAIPVTDERGRLQGVVTIDDVVDVIRDEATEDIFQMAGTSADERLDPSILKSTRRRSPWLLASFVGGILAMLVIRAFDGTVQQLFGLAALLPVVIGVGGSAGNQAATVIIRGLATGRVHRGEYLSNFIREFGVSILLGTLYGFLVALAVFAYSLWAGDEGLVTPESASKFGTYGVLVSSLLIGVSLTLSMLVSSSVGTLMPLAMDRAGIDPAVATTPFVTTVTDFAGSAIFYGLVSAILFI